MRQSLADGEPGGCEGQDKHASKSGRGGAGESERQHKFISILFHALIFCQFLHA